MPEFRLGPISLKAPDDYMPRMFVITAPEKAQPKAGIMVTKDVQRFARNITIATEEVGENTTAAEYADAQLVAMKQGLQGFSLMKRSTTPVGNTECPLLEIQSSGPEGRLLQAMTAYFVKDKLAFTLSASHMAGIPYQDTRKEYLAIFASITLT